MTSMYMCGTDYEHELGNIDVKLYDSISSLRRDRPCVEECGIVEVNVSLVRWVQDGIPYSERGNKETTQEAYDETFAKRTEQ
jgi:hypothetical protein